MGVSPPDDRLRRLLGGAELAWLVARVRGRMERGERLDTTVVLAGATEAQRRAVGRLLGRRAGSGGSLSVPLATVDEVLRRSGACTGGLTAAVVALTGPVVQRSEVSAARDRAWHDAFAPLTAAVDRHGGLAEWLSRLLAAGLVRRLLGTPEAAGPVLTDLAAMLDQLPAAGEPVGLFAGRMTGNAHALDDDRPLATLLVGAARAMSGLPDGAGAGWRREVLASVGLLRDDVSSTVLTLGLPGDDRTATGRALAAWHLVGQPVLLTLRQLVRDPPRLTDRRVSVCENPVVVSAAADRLGAGCRPLVCIAGQPGAAALRLLRLVADAGAELRYHGDFDWGGIRIGNVLGDRLPVRPWRFTAADYLEAPAGHPLTGRRVEARWDRELSLALDRRGTAVEEELVLDDLMLDLAT